MKADKIILSWTAGSLDYLYKNAVMFAKEVKCPHVEFPFNGIKIIVTDRSYPELSGENFDFVLDCVRDKMDAYL